MKTLIYDNECPLCVAYTGAFVKAGLLEKEERKSFNEMPMQTMLQLNVSRCHNEIPLIDSKTGKTWYGIDAMLEVLGARYPFIKKAGKLTAANWILKKMYKLISYNRKVIVAVKPSGYDCSPAFNSRYRILLIVIGIIFNSWIFSKAIPLISNTIFPESNYTQLQATHFTLITINICIGMLLGKRKGLEYLGQINMLAFISMGLTIPLIGLQNVLTTALLCSGIGIAGTIVIREYFRRMNYAGILQNNKLIVAINAICVLATFMYLYF